MSADSNLRPIERRVLEMRRGGMDLEEIGARLRHSPGHIRRIIELIKLRPGRPRPQRDPRPLERRVIVLRSRGEPYSKIARRFGRSPRFIRQVEGFTYIKHGRSTRAFRHGAALLEQTAAEARRRRTLRNTPKEV